MAPSPFEPLVTTRLLLRPMGDGDLEPFAALNADPEVMEFFPAALTREEAAALIERTLAHQERHGFTFWGVERREDGALLGMCGLGVPTWEAAFTPCVEIGWRLARAAWGHGYASEAARACLNFGFQRLGLEEILSFTSVQNLRSRAVMERIGMARDLAGDFDHPRLPPGHPLQRHVLYRIGRPPR